MAKNFSIKWLKDQLGAKFFPITHIKAVRDDDCVSLDDLLKKKQDKLISGVNIKTINNYSLLGSGNINIHSSEGTENIIEIVKVNGIPLTPDSNKAVNVNVPTRVSNLVNDAGYTSNTGTLTGIKFNNSYVPVQNGVASITAPVPETITETTVSNWGFTKNTGTYSKPNGGIPKTDLSSAVQASLRKADSALQSEDIASELTNSNQPVSASAVYNVIVEEEEVISAALNDLNSRIANIVVEETDPTVPAWAKQETKPSYTAFEVGAVPTSRTINSKSLSSNITLTAADVNALPASTVIPSKLSDLTNDAGFITSSDLAGFITSSDLVDEVSQEDKPVTANAVYEYITEIEKVIASSLNDLNARLTVLEIAANAAY